MMCEAAAWRYLARRWDVAARPGRGFNVEVRLVGRVFAWGLCSALRHLEDRASGRRGALWYDTVRAMQMRLCDNRGGIGVGYWWPNSRAGARLRAAYCRRMARLAEREARNT